MRLRTNTVALISLVLLAGCVPGNKSEKDSTSTIETGIQEIDTFIASISKLTDHPNIANASVSTEYNYMTDGGDYFTMNATDTFTIERFLLNKKDGITVREGVYAVEGDESKYVAQTYHDDEKFYLLTNYKSALDTDTKKTIAYDEKSLEVNLSINFSYKEIANLVYLASFADDDSVLGEYELPESINDNGDTTYKYSLTAYQDGYLQQKISHQVTFTVENGVIVSSKQIVENDLFGGTRQKVNYTVTTTEATYEQGAYKEFDGELFDPDKFVESAS